MKSFTREGAGRGLEGGKEGRRRESEEEHKEEDEVGMDGMIDDRPT